MFSYSINYTLNLIFRVYLAIATEEDLRGLIVQQGAAKVCFAFIGCTK